MPKGKRYKEGDLGICEQCNGVIKFMVDGEGLLGWLHFESKKLLSMGDNHDAVKVEL
jgi:hypothetical protein